MALVRRGVPAHWLRTLAAAMDLSRSTLFSLLGLKLSTIKAPPDLADCHQGPQLDGR